MKTQKSFFDTLTSGVVMICLSVLALESTNFYFKMGGYALIVITVLALVKIISELKNYRQLPFSNYQLLWLNFIVNILAKTGLAVLFKGHIVLVIATLFTICIEIILQVVAVGKLKNIKVI